MKIISWNINGGFASKFSDKKFQCYILSYDIVLLTECWIENNFSIDVEGFHSFVFPRMRSKSKQGGGCVILIREKLKHYVSLLENMCNTIIWLKLDTCKCLLDSSEDFYLACVYIPPNSSTFYQAYDCGIFCELENQIVKYLTRTSRTAKKFYRSRNKQEEPFVNRQRSTRTLRRDCRP